MVIIPIAHIIRLLFLSALVLIAPRAVAVQDFDTWLKGLQVEALEQGIS